MNMTLMRNFVFVNNAESLAFISAVGFKPCVFFNVLYDHENVGSSIVFDVDICFSEQWLSLIRCFSSIYVLYIFYCHRCVFNLFGFYSDFTFKLYLDSVWLFLQCV